MVGSGGAGGGAEGCCCQGSCVALPESQEARLQVLMTSTHTHTLALVDQQAVTHNTWHLNPISRMVLVPAHPTTTSDICGLLDNLHAMQGCIV